MGRVQHPAVQHEVRGALQADGATGCGPGAEGLGLPAGCGWRWPWLEVAVAVQGFEWGER